MLLCSPQSEIAVTPTTVFPFLFEQQVLQSPDAIAIEFEGDRWTYREVNRRANQLAKFLLDRPMAIEGRIGICMDRSANAIICMLGIMKSGCAFVPLDPEFPKDRLAYIVEDASIDLVLCDKRYRELFDQCSTNSPDFQDPCDPQLWLSDGTNLGIEISDNSLAYVMYTSGSTGKPKGVQIEHGSLTTYCLADIELYRLTRSDRTLQFSTLNFDIAIEEIFPPLLVGSTVVVRPLERSGDSNELSNLVESYQITALHIATAYWHEWVDLMMASLANVPTCLRLLIATGEKVSVEHFRRWKRLCKHEVLWCNAYGPTETTVTCTCFIPDQNWDQAQMPIGKPLLGYSAHILNDENQELGVGETGNLFISGRALARGYLNRPELNQKAFIQVNLAGRSEPTRLYRTGDLARWLPSGDLEFSGRIDHQMKIGSYRIEPGEIEAVLSQCDSVDESLVACFEYAGHKYLAAYVVLNNKNVSAFALATFLRERLPVYMIPSRYVFIDAFPKTINGKIDRPALPPPESGTVARDGKICESENQLERDLTAIWSNVLNISDVSRHDDFFQLGGSSLLATRAIAQITKSLHLTIPVRDFFANPTIASLGCHLQSLTAPSTASDQNHTSQVSCSIASESRVKLPRIRPLSIPSGACPLAVIQYPAQREASTARNHSLVICNAIGHEHTRSFRNLQQLAVRLSQIGFDVFRFDYAGTGNSQGKTADMSLQQWRQDVYNVIHHVKESQSAIDPNTWIKVSVLGIRLGATFLAQSPLDGVEHAILWDPVADGDTYLKQMRSMHQYELRSLTRFLNRRKAHHEQFMGYRYPNAMQNELESIRISFSITGRAQRNWIITSKDQRLPFSALQNLSNWNLRECPDEIYWYESRYVQSAFSSPHANRQIEAILTEGSNR